MQTAHFDAGKQEWNLQGDKLPMNVGENISEVKDLGLGVFKLKVGENYFNVV